MLSFPQTIIKRLFLSEIILDGSNGILLSMNSCAAVLFSCMNSHTWTQRAHQSHTCVHGLRPAPHMHERKRCFDRREQVKAKGEKIYGGPRERAQQCQEIHSLRLSVCDLLSTGTVTETHANPIYILILSKKTQSLIH